VTVTRLYPLTSLLLLVVVVVVQSVITPSTHRHQPPSRYVNVSLMTHPMSHDL